MGDDYDRAEDEYWEVRSMGYSDADIIAMDQWPTGPKYQTGTPLRLNPDNTLDARDQDKLSSVRQARESVFDQDSTLSASEAAMYHRQMKARTSPIGEPIKSDKIKKEMRMINKKNLIKDLEETIAAAQRELDLLKRIPSEPEENMTSFTVTFENSSKPYVYVGLRINGKWRVSGRHFVSGSYSWSGIFERFEAIHAKVLYISTPTDFRHEQVYN